MECRCVTGGLHVDGTCLVCYRPAPKPHRSYLWRDRIRRRIALDRERRERRARGMPSG